MTEILQPRHKAFVPVNAGGIDYLIPTVNQPEAVLRSAADKMRAVATTPFGRRAAELTERHADLRRVFTTVPHALIGAAIEAGKPSEDGTVMRTLTEDDVMMRLDLKGFSALTYQLLKGLMPREITDSRLEMLGEMTSMKIEELQNLMLTLQNEMSRGTYNGPKELFNQFQKIFNVIARIVTTYGGGLIGFEGDACNIIVNRMTVDPHTLQLEGPARTLERAATIGLEIQEAFALKQGDLQDTPLECRVGITVVRPGEDVKFIAHNNLVTAVGSSVVERLYYNESNAPVGKVGLDNFSANMLAGVGLKGWAKSDNPQMYVLQTETFRRATRVHVPIETKGWQSTKTIVDSFDQIAKNERNSPVPVEKPVEGKTCIVYGVIGAIDKTHDRPEAIVGELGEKFAELKLKYGVDLLKRTGSDDHGNHSFIFDVAEAEFGKAQVNSLTGEALTYIEAAVRASTELYNFLKSKGIHSKMGISSGTRIHGTIAGTNDSYGDTVTLAARGEQRAPGEEGVYCDIATTTHLLLNGIRVVGNAVKVEAKGFPNPLNFRQVRGIEPIEEKRRLLRQRLQTEGRNRNKITNPTPQQIKHEIDVLFRELGVRDNANGTFDGIVRKIWENSGIDFAKTMQEVIVVDSRWQSPVSDTSLAIVEAMLPDLIRAIDEGEPLSQIYNILSLSAALSEPVKAFYEKIRPTYIVDRMDEQGSINLAAFLPTLSGGRTVPFRKETIKKIVSKLKLRPIEYSLAAGNGLVQPDGKIHTTDALDDLLSVLKAENFLNYDEATGRYELFGPLAQLAYRTTPQKVREQYHGIIADHLHKELEQLGGSVQRHKQVVLSMLFHARSAGLSEYVLDYVVPTYEQYLGENELEAVRFYTRWAVDAAGDLIHIAAPALAAKVDAETLLGITDEQTFTALTRILSSDQQTLATLDESLVNQLIISRAVLNAKLNNQNKGALTALYGLIDGYRRNVLHDDELNLNNLNEHHVVLMARAISGLLEIVGMKYIQQSDDLVPAYNLARHLLESDELRAQHPDVWARLAFYYGRYALTGRELLDHRQALYRDAKQTLYMLDEQNAWTISTMVLLNTEVHYTEIEERIEALESTLTLAKSKNILQGLARTLNKHSQLVLEEAKHSPDSQNRLRSILSKLEHSILIAEGGRDFEELGMAHVRLAQYHQLNGHFDLMAAEVSLAENAFTKGQTPAERVEQILAQFLAIQETNS